MEDLSMKGKRAIFALNSRIKISLLPIPLALKIFSSQILPILLYGSEVWGPYSELNFQSWDKNIIEKTHTQFIKRLLGCDIHSPNLMIRAELGMRPLLCKIIKRSTLYMKHIESVNETLANQALDYEISLDDDCNILSLVRSFTPYFSEINHYVSPQNKQEVKKQTNEFYDNIWKTEINKLSKSDSYLLFKNHIKLEKYTWVIKNPTHRKALSRLRLSSHHLMIEKGRHQKPLLIRSERKCPFCKDTVEDECHFITSCPLYRTERTQLFHRLNNNAPMFINIPTIWQKFSFIMSNEDPKVISQLAHFIYHSFKIRSNFLESQ